MARKYTRRIHKQQQKTSGQGQFQGVASLGSERLEECNSEAVLPEDHPKTRVRYSGAARTATRNSFRGRERPKTKSLSLKLILVLGPAAVEPRLWRLNAPGWRITPIAPSILARVNDPRLMIKGADSAICTSEQRACQTSLEDFPDKKLGVAECGLIRKMIRGRILELPEATKAPTFSGSWERDGAYVFVCDDEQSEDWLKSLSSDLKMEGNSLRVVPVDELPRCHRVVIHMDEPDLSAEETLKLLGRQNTGLTTEDWIVTRGSVSRDATFACLIDGQFLDVL
ncbi:hypothetical protein EAG_12816 [Camponotus floridanus]|uniref:DUF4780 domain-containing protein n=1 Tax=Camponotus floridanus TaxID=104421 RepID=E2AT33_CAMFO|nr:hypothetical protein EAG_12816 [Camponotus floridanus]